MGELGVVPSSAARGPVRRPVWMITRVVPVLLVLALAVAGCGSSSSSSSASGSSGSPATPQVHFAKTKFLLHAGLAFGAFHRYIYKPFRNGGFTPVTRHKLAIVKAGAAALFVYHELKIALVDAQSSPTLSKLVSPLTALESKVNGLGHSLHGGQVDSTGITSANSGVSSISGQSAQSGAPIHDLATSAVG